MVVLMRLHPTSNLKIAGLLAHAYCLLGLPAPYLFIHQLTRRTSEGHGQSAIYGNPFLKTIIRSKTR